MFEGYLKEHEEHQRHKAKRTRKGVPSRTFKGNDWSPISPDSAGGWWLYGDHFDSREEAEAELTRRRAS